MKNRKRKTKRASKTRSQTKIRREATDDQTPEAKTQAPWQGAGFKGLSSRGKGRGFQSRPHSVEKKYWRS